MKDTELKRMRDEALYNVYVKALQEGSFTSFNDIISHIVKQPAPQYFISAEKLSEYIGMVEAHRSLISFNSTSRRRIWMLYDLYIAWKNAFPETCLSRQSILEILVNEPAPEFFLGDSAARQIIQQMRNKKQQALANRR